MELTLELVARLAGGRRRHAVPRSGEDVTTVGSPNQRVLSRVVAQTNVTLAGASGAARQHSNRRLP